MALAATSKENEVMKDERYERELRALSIELVKLQRDVIASGRKVLVIVEGRDAAGKDGLIKTLTAHLSPRESRIVALGKPTSARTRSGTSSAGSRSSPRPAKSSSSTAAGTTAPASSA